MQFMASAASTLHIIVSRVVKEVLVMAMEWTEWQRLRKAVQLLYLNRVPWEVGDRCLSRVYLVEEGQMYWVTPKE